MIVVVCLLFTAALAQGAERWGTAALMVIVERAAGSVLVVDSARHELLGRVGGLGNLGHATVKFSKDARYAYVIGRLADVTKVDLLTLTAVKRVKAGDLSVGGTMTQDGRHLALSNYVPGEVRILDAESLATAAVIPAVREYPDGRTVQSRVVGLVDAPGNLLIFSLMDADGVWVVDAGRPDFPVVQKFWDVGKMPYDALITPEGRHYLVGFLNSNWMGVLDTWNPSGVRKILTQEEEVRGEDVPLWKVPHLKGWAIAGELAFLPAVKRKQALVYRMKDWSLAKAIPLAGTALYTVVSPDRRRVWVDLVGENGDLVQVIDVERLEVIRTLTPGKGATHPQFTPKGDAVYVSLMDGGKVLVYDAQTFEPIREFAADRPSGIFGSDRAHKFGM